MPHISFTCSMISIQNHLGSTWMGDHQKRLCAVRLRLYSGDDMTWNESIDESNIFLWRYDHQRSSQMLCTELRRIREELFLCTHYYKNGGYEPEILSLGSDQLIALVTRHVDLCVEITSAHYIEWDKVSVNTTLIRASDSFYVVCMLINNNNNIKTENNSRIFNNQIKWHSISCLLSLILPLNKHKALTPWLTPLKIFTRWISILLQ